MPESRASHGAVISETSNTPGIPSETNNPDPCARERPTLCLPPSPPKEAMPSPSPPFDPCSDPLAAGGRRGADRRQPYGHGPVSHPPSIPPPPGDWRSARAPGVIRDGPRSVGVRDPPRAPGQPLLRRRPRAPRSGVRPPSPALRGPEPVSRPIPPPSRASLSVLPRTETDRWMEFVFSGRASGNPVRFLRCLCSL